MAEFNCQCGKVLDNSRTGDALYIFDEQEILAACQQVQGLSLDDFIANWRRWALRDNVNVFYWKCPDCGKMLFKKKGKQLLICHDKDCGYKREAEDNGSDEE